MSDITSTETIGTEAIATPARLTAKAISEKLQGAAMVAILVGGFAMGMVTLADQRAHEKLVETSNLPAMLAGKTAAAINYAMAHYLPVDEAFREIGGVLRWRLFASGGPQVWSGRHDWLFLTEELRPWPDAARIQETRADTVQHVAAQLHARGIDLLVAVVPDKARLMAAELDGPRAAENGPRFDAFVSQLRQRGLPVVDLNAPLAEAARAKQVFYRTDTHWNQDGAAIAARAVAGAVTTGIDRSHPFRTETAPAETDGPGDLLRLMSLDNVPDGLWLKLRPHADRQHLEKTVDAAPSDGGDLLGDASAIEVALIGSSYSVNANFIGRLREALSADVSNFAKAGGGFAGSAHSYFAGTAFRETKPKLVIWEIPERVIGQPLTEDDRALETVFQARN